MALKNLRIAIALLAKLALVMANAEGSKANGASRLDAPNSATRLGEDDGLMGVSGTAPK